MSEQRLHLIAALERGILELLEQRAPGATICPSEVARGAAGAGWRQLMEPVRDAAWRLQASGKVVIMQQGRMVQRAEVRGPIRIGLPAVAPGPSNQDA